MPTFRMRANGDEAPDSPEALFRDLRPRDRQVRDLYLRQGDVLRAYHELAPQPSDVALELPTGAGKTLVGLLIAEYRRRALGHRVAFLCPNVQLARQAAAKADAYGIEAVALVRKQRDWDSGEFLRFQRGRAIAVSTYSAVFNSNPRLDTAQTLILDDAHAGEDPVSNLWSIRAPRGHSLYLALLDLVAEAMPGATVDQLRDDGLRGRRRSYVELIPPIALVDRAQALRETLAAHIEDRTPNAYVLDVMGGFVDRCLLYIGWREALLRPLIPPTADHTPFSGADQRVYMSATLGSGGELERAFGVPNIVRPRMPTRDDERGFGRRLFLMPGAALSNDDADVVIQQAVDVAEPQRAVFLAQSDAEIDEMAEKLLDDEMTQVTPREIERTPSSFVNADRAVLALSNRYDGIDLPDEACRLIVLSGLPKGVHLQERFLSERLGAQRVLAERIRTRLTQGAGRCTRNPQDYAAVLLRGSDLIDFCSRDEELAALRPELQAEIEFGLDNSEQGDLDLLDLLASFFKRDSAWDAADHYIRGRTAGLQRTLPAGSEALQRSASYEVECWLAVARGDLERAIELAQKAIDALSGGSELRPYVALWFYLAASWARALAENMTPGYGQLSDQLQADAESAARGLKWYPRHSAPPTSEIENDERSDRAAAALEAMGVRGPKFERRLAAIAADLAQDEADPFERGLCALGELLGFDSMRPQGQAAPDGLWATGQAWIVWEAKTNKKADGVLDAEEVRQAETHPRWLERNAGLSRPAKVITVIVMPTPGADRAVADVGGEQWVVATDTVRGLLDRTATAYRAVRSRARGLDDLARSMAFAAEFSSRDLGTDALMAELVATSVIDLAAD
jgi:Type III restriction enzyme, res subunit/Helicase C-terminal domain